MHLLKITQRDDSSLDIDLHENLNENIKYAILSHRWGPVEDEVSYYDFTKQKEVAQKKKGYRKIEACCRQAVKDNIYYVWIDTCCIDKSSSAELSEAINSMYRWYKHSTICYAYLEDVVHEDYMKSDSTFRRSRWFTRGWTLQELIAPKEIRFYNADWAIIGLKSRLALVLSEITNIVEDVLLNEEVIEDICVSQKMYWASKRQTSRVEDRAYSLLGLFDLSLPIIYGEGERSFRRLQEEIIRVTFDHTIFAWEMATTTSGLLAKSPDAFAQSAKIRKMRTDWYQHKFNLLAKKLKYSITNLGLEIGLAYSRSLSHPEMYVVFLACYVQDESEDLFLYLRTTLSGLFFRSRTLKGSLGFGKAVPEATKGCKIFIGELREYWANVYRDLVPPEELAAEIEGGRRTEYYRLRGEGINCSFGTHYPMPSSLNESRFCIETEANIIWVMSVELHDGLVDHLGIMVLLTFLDNELVGHLEAYDRRRSDSPYWKPNSFAACEAFYERCKLSSDTPCTEFEGTARYRKNHPKESSAIFDDIFYDYDLSFTLCQDHEILKVHPHSRLYHEVQLIQAFGVDKRRQLITENPRLLQLKESTLSLKEIIARCAPLYRSQP